MTSIVPLHNVRQQQVTSNHAITATHDDPMATQYLEENRQLKHTLEATKQLAALEKEALIKKLKAALAESEASNMRLQAAVRRLESKNRAERVLHHTAKNTMAEAQASIELYISAHAEDSLAKDFQILKSAVVGLQHGLRIIWRSLQIASIFEGSYIPKSEVIAIEPWAAGKAPANMELDGETGSFLVEEPVAADLFRILTYDNVTAHGLPGHEVGFCSTFEDGYLTIDISNAINDSHRNCEGPQETYGFSTGLGLGDLKDICKCRDIDFSSSRGPDGLWHSIIHLKASEVKTKSLPVEDSEQPLRTYLPKHVVIVDDMPSILRMTSFKFEKRLPDAIIDAIHIHDKVSYDNFVEATIPSLRATCDLVLMDQHLDLNGGGIKEGTELLDMLQESGCRACLVMHSGNNTEKDVQNYRSHGAHGVIGKGGRKVQEEAIAIFQTFVAAKL